MESVSDNKRGRGRPRKYSESDYRGLGLLGRGSIKTKQNRLSAQRAYDTIMGSAYASAFVMMVDGAPKLKIKETVLAELGRFRDARSIVPAALNICREQMSTRKAVALIRRMRGAAKGPSYADLGMRLYNCILHYYEQYPTLSDQDVAEAIKGAALFRVKPGS
jgi:hypothetical protein